jgi:hypothetical protein
VGEILDAAFRLCFTHWRPLVTATLVVVVPLQILATIVLYSVFPELVTIASDEVVPSTETSEEFSEAVDRLNEQLAVAFAGALVFILLAFLMTLLTIAACFKAVADAYLGSEPDWRASLRFAVVRLGPLLGISLLNVVGVTLGLIVLIIPGIFLAVAWALCFPAALVEGRRGVGALRRSYQLVKGRWWPVFGALLVGIILVAIISNILEFIVLAPTFFSESLLGEAILSGLASIVGFAVTTPLQAAIVTLVYFDQRVRKEGLDLELLAQSLGTEAPAAPAGGGSPSPGAQVPPGWAPPGGAEPSPQR